MSFKEKAHDSYGNYMTASAVVATSWKLWKAAKGRVTYSVKVQGNEWLFDEVHRWLLEAVADHKIRSVRVETRSDDSEEKDNESVLVGGTPQANSRRLKVFADDRSSHIVHVDGYRVEVVTGADEHESARNAQEREWLKHKEFILFRTTSVAARKAVLNLLTKLKEDKETRGNAPKFYLGMKWGSWSERSDLPMRHMESVILRAGVIERLVHDLGTFLEAEKDYVQRSIPFHRGYLFEGPPGTGKTTIAKALAQRFGLSIYWLPLGDLEDDSRLIDLVSSVPPRSILLLEDVDVFHAATSRDEDVSKVSLSGLLNALDGIATPHGLVTVLTTNSLESLEEALVRGGRVDCAQHFDYVDQDQANRMFQAFYGREPWRHFRIQDHMDVSPADVQKHFQKFMYDPEGAEREWSAQLRAA